MQLGGENAHELDVLAEHAGHHPLEREHGHVQIEHLGHEQLAAAEGEQLTGERGGPVGSRLDAAEESAARRGVGPLAAELLGVAADDLQQVVEVVRHAAGQAAEGADFLRAPQLLGEVLVVLERLLEAAPFRGVADRRHRQPHAGHGGDEDIHRELVAVGAPAGGFAARRRIGRRQWTSRRGAVG